MNRPPPALPADDLALRARVRRSARLKNRDETTTASSKKTNNFVDFFDDGDEEYDDDPLAKVKELVTESDDEYQPDDEEASDEDDEETLRGEPFENLFSVAPDGQLMAAPSRRRISARSPAKRQGGGSSKAFSMLLPNVAASSSSRFAGSTTEVTMSQGNIAAKMQPSFASAFGASNGAGAGSAPPSSMFDSLLCASALSYPTISGFSGIASNRPTLLDSVRRPGAAAAAAPCAPLLAPHFPKPASPSGKAAGSETSGPGGGSTASSGHTGEPNSSSLSLSAMFADKNDQLSEAYRMAVGALFYIYKYSILVHCH